jgi:hypothetical protein
MGNGEAHLLSPEQAMLYWPEIDKELDTVRHAWEIWWTKEALRQGVLDGWLNVWAIGGRESISLILFTQIVHYPANKMLRVVLIVGNRLEEFFDIAEAALEKYCINTGCLYIEAHGRDGWGKRVPGIVKHGTMFTRKVTNLRVQ